MPRLCHTAGAGLGGTTADSNELLYSPVPGGEAGTPGPSWLQAGACKEGLVLGSPEIGPCSPPGQAAHLLGCPATQTRGRDCYTSLERLPKATTGVRFPGGALGPAVFYEKQRERGVSPTGLVARGPSTEGLSGPLPCPHLPPTACYCSCRPPSPPHTAEEGPPHQRSGTLEAEDRKEEPFLTI